MPSAVRRAVLIAAAVATVALVVVAASAPWGDDHEAAQLLAADGATTSTSTRQTTTSTPAMTTVAPTSPAAPTPPIPAPSAIEDLGGGWTRYPPSPLVVEAGINGVGREGSTAVWTGDELVIWGGGVDGGPSYADGAALEPDYGVWRPTAPSPIGPRDGHVAAWTGDEMIVWGGVDRLGSTTQLDDGAAWDPEANRWRILAPSPLQGGYGYAVAWTGEEVVVWGDPADPTTLPAAGPVPTTPRTGAAAYDPESDSWRQLPDIPLPLSSGELHWTGEELMLVGVQAFTIGDFINRRGEVVIASFEPAANEWRVLPVSGISGQSATAAWTGEALYVLTYYPSLDGTRIWDASRRRWKDGPRFPDDGCEGIPALFNLDGRLVGSVCGTVAVLDPSGKRWEVEDLPRVQPEIRAFSSVQAGDRLFFEQVDKSMVSFRPR